MSEKKMNGAGGVSWETLWKFAKAAAPTAITLLAFAAGGTWAVATMIGEFRGAHAKSDAKNIEQDETLAEHETIFSNHETRIDGVELNVARLGPAAADREVENAISLVQDAIDCEMAACDESCWVSVPAASSSYLSDELRVRVEEHFRRLGYEVTRERQLPSGRLRCFWIFVRQSDGGEISGLGDVADGQG